MDARDRVDLQVAEDAGMTVETPQPEYRQVAALLREAIQAGEWPPGSAIPAEPELAARFGVTRAVVNRALSVLRAEGLLKPRRGQGTTVNELPVLTRSTIARQGRQSRERGQARGAFAAELAEKGISTRVDVTVSGTEAPEQAVRMFGGQPGLQVVERRRVMYAADVPVQLATSWIPAAIAGGTQIEQEDTGPGGVYSRLADLGYAPVRFREITRLRVPDDRERQALELDPDHRVFDIWRSATTASGQVVEVNSMVLPAHQWELDTEWDAEP
jgi:GntR family transcriptional regulator